MDNIIDKYLEHVDHLLYEPKCSTCWSENLRIVDTKERMSHEELNEDRGGHYEGSSLTGNEFI